MTEVLVGSGGVRVERILVQRHLDRPAREMLRVRRGTYLVADCATVAEGAQPVRLAKLCRSSAEQPQPGTFRGSLP